MPTRNFIPVTFKLNFLWYLIIHFLNSRSFKDSFVFSIVKVLEPKILITFIDNSDIMGKIHKQFPNKTTISVQNGFRSGLNYLNGTYSKKPVSIYFGFGEHEGVILKKNNIENKEYISSGSLLFSLFKKSNTRKNIKKYDICFISQFNTSKDLYINGLMKSSTEIYLSLLKICQRYDFSISVAMRYNAKSKQYIDECNFYNEIDTNSLAKLIPNNDINFQGYKTASESRVLISVNSTLAFEMFGSGSKVLFGASSNKFELAYLWDSYESFNKLPKFNLLDNNNEDSIYKKLIFLMELDKDDYLAKTKLARKYYMNYSDTNLARKLIKNKIEEILLN